MGAYLLGLATLPTLAAVCWFVFWGFSRDRGFSECSIPQCNRVEWEPGAHFNVTVWVRVKWHELVTNRPGSAHRRHVMDFWRTKRDKGFPIHPQVRKWLDRQERKATP